MENILREYRQALKKQGIVTISCRLSPGARKTEIKELMASGELKIRVSSAPEKGKANLELLKLLAEKLEVPVNNVRIKRGQTSKLKVIEVIK
ncbi:MAG: DUF167 domain-containing protein [Candidatus Pacebacteria bacterium]|nr:DUF167 domain-containing protein [Candidatus Paceibacterota bacterium]